MWLLILRPEPGASATAARAAARGLEAMVAPLFAVRPLDWDAPDPTGFDALLLTSANAVRHAGGGLAEVAGLPTYAVGEATASAARDAGLTLAGVGDSDGGALLEKAADDGVRRLLHLCGREHRPIAHPEVAVERRIVYASEAATPPPALFDAVADGAVALLHSPRAAATFARLVDPAAARIAAISARALAAAGPGWREARAAAEPTDDALLALAASMCD